MLQSIREKAQGAFAIIVIGLLCLTFAVWGVESYLSAARRVVVADVNGEEVELKDYQQTFQRLRQRAQAELGDAFDATLWTQEETKLKVLDYVVEDSLLTQTLSTAGLRISAAQVGDYLRSSPNFQVDGRFSAERYAQVTSMLGFSEQAFEAQTQRDLALQQLRAGVQASSFLTSQDVTQVEHLLRQTRDVAYAIVPVVEPATAETDETELRSYYDKKKEAYRLPDRVAIEYVEIKLDDLARDVSVDAAAIQTYYDAHLAEFTVEEQRAANHVLVQVKEGASADDDAAAKRKAEEMRALVLGGKPIEDVAREFSDDIGSRAEGGATGLFGRGVMVPEFEQAVFSMKTGDVSEPVKSKFGYHVIKLTEVKPGGVKPMEEVRAEITERVAREQAQERYYELAERFTDTVLEHPDSLQSAADALELKIQSASAQSQDQLAAAFSPALAEAVWESDVLTDRLVSQPVEIGDDRIVAARVTSFEAAHVPELDAVKIQVTLDMKFDQMRDSAIARGKSLLARIEKGEDPVGVMAAEKLEWKVIENATREDERANRAVLRAAFKAAVPEGAEKRFLGIETGSGEYAVAQVGPPKSPAAEDTKPDARLKAEIARLRSAAYWRDFVASLKRNASIETDPASL